MNKFVRAATVVSVLGVFLIVAASPAFAPCHIGSFVGAPYRVAEGAGKVTITYSNGAGAQPGGTADYRTEDATAKAPKDYTSTHGTLTWGGTASAGVSASGVSPANRGFDVPIIQDSLDEPNETFTIRMSHFTGCFDAQISEKSATVTIVDDDSTPVPKKTSPNPTPKTSTPAVTRTPTTTPTPTATRTPTLTPSPSSTSTALVTRDTGSGNGLSGGAVAGIVAAVVVIGGAAAFFVRRRFLT